MLGEEEIVSALKSRGKTLIPLLDYEEVKKYAKYVWKRSRSSEALRTSLYVIKDFLNFANKDPKTLIEEIKEEKINIVEVLNNYIDTLFFKRKVKPSTIRSARIPYIKTFLKKNGVSFDDDELEYPSDFSESQDRIPTKEELREFLNVLDLKVKLAVLLMATSGLRIGVLPKLKIKHIDFESEPVKITVPAWINKSKFSYFTYTTPETAKILKAYLEERKKRGEKITEESYLFVTKYGEPYRGRTLEELVRREIRRHMKVKKLPGYKVNKYDIHIHSFRKFFRTMLEVAGVKRSFREFLLGHKGDYLDESYFRPFEEQVREEYKKAIPHLTILEVETPSIEEIRRKQLIDMAKLLGFSEEKIKKIEEILAKYKSVDEAMDEIRKLREEEMLPNGGRKIQVKLVSEKELVNYLETGWEIIKELKSGKIVIKREIS
ncbi:MAG: tyrosine-type recombinase/integrase [Candidatus Baldrarchaeia archaeon]